MLLKCFFIVVISCNQIAVQSGTTTPKNDDSDGKTAISTNTTVTPGTTVSTPTSTEKTTSMEKVTTTTEPPTDAVLGDNCSAVTDCNRTISGSVICNGTCQCDKTKKNFQYNETTCLEDSRLMPVIYVNSSISQINISLSHSIKTESLNITYNVTATAETATTCSVVSNFAVCNALVPGTSYNISVAVLLEGTGLSVQNSTIAATDPAIPGEVSETQSNLNGPNITLTWEQSAGKVEYYNITIDEHQPATTYKTSNNTVLIYNLKDGQRYNVSIVAFSNDQMSGTRFGSFKTDVKAPDSPRNATVSMVTNSSLTLQWIQPNEVRGELVGYQICVQSKIYEDEDFQPQDCLNTTAKYDNTTKVHNFKGLIAGAFYKFEIFTKNEAFLSNDNASAEARTNQTEPGTVEELTVKPYNDTLNVTWSRPSRPNGDIISYTLRWMETSSKAGNWCEVLFTSGPPNQVPSSNLDEEDCPNETVSISVNQRAMQYKIEGLAAFTNYTIVVVASTVIGDGPKLNTTQQTSLQKKFPLQDVTVTNQSETSITLTVTVNKNSSFDAYLVVRDDGTAHNFSALSDKTLTVTGLLPGTKYTLFVFIIFENLTSDENISVTGATEPGAVQNIHLVEHLTTEHSITIKWDPPNHGQVDSYMVSEKHYQPNMSDYVVHISVTKPFYTVSEISNTETVNVSIASQYWNLTGVETQWSLHRDCGPPPPLEHGNFTYFADFPQNTGYGSFLNYQCDNKYRLESKQSFRHCNPNGNWIGPHLACIVIDCGNVTDPVHGHANLNSSGFGDIVTYKCEPGFEIHGVDTRTCLDTGSWNGETPTCRKATLKNCPESEDRHGTVWKTVNSGRTVTMPCDKGFQGTKSRQCQADGTWSLSVYSCTRQEILTIQNKLDVLIQSNASNVYVDEEVSRTLVSISNLTARGNKSEADSPAFEGEIVAVTSVLEKVAKLSVNINITEQQSQDFIDTASNILDPVNAQAYQAIENTSGNKSNTGAQTILQAMETFAGSFAKSVDVSTTPNKTLASKSLFVTVGAIQNVSSGVYFPEESNLDRESTTRLFLPRSAVNGYLLYTGILYKNLTGILPSIILRNGEKFDQQKINSAVISLKLVRASSRLLQPLTISFEHQVENYSNPTCSFWNFMRNAWDTDGCRKISTNTSFTTCSCNHLTNFAILMNPWQPGFSTEEQAAINYITIVLCSVSGVCLLLTVILQLSFWRYLKRQTRNPPVILVNLSVALAISYVIFLTGVDRTEHQNICRAIAVSLQYIYLVVFFLMLAEGIEISLATVFIFSAAEKIKKWLVPLAWVVPVVIVAIAMGITKLDGFGNDKYCWLSIENGLIWSFVGPALTVIVINVVLLFLIIKIMLTSKYIEDKAKTEKFVKLKSSVKCLCVLLPLMGLTWITGILYVNDNFAWTQYVFAISNGLQGVVIFVMHCLFNKPLKDAILRVKKRYQDTTWTQDKQMTNSSNYRLSTLESELSVTLDSVKWTEKEQEIHDRM